METILGISGDRCPSRRSAGGRVQCCVGHAILLLANSFALRSLLHLSNQTGRTGQSLLPVWLIKQTHSRDLVRSRVLSDCEDKTSGYSPPENWSLQYFILHRNIFTAVQVTRIKYLQPATVCMYSDSKLRLVQLFRVQPSRSLTQSSGAIQVKTPEHTL